MIALPKRRCEFTPIGADSQRTETRSLDWLQWLKPRFVVSMTGEPSLTARAMIEAVGYDLEVAESVVVVYDPSLMPVARVPRRDRRRHPFRQVGSLGDGVDIVAAAGPGAPVAAITVEFLAAFGARQLVSIGTAGDLRRDPTSATRHGPRVISHAVSDEGTSAHYGGNLTADPNLVERLQRCLGAPAQIALTTDAPFRHTPERLADHRSKGDLVEMECAAFLAAANYFGVSAGSVLVPSDAFDGETWQLAEIDPHDELVSAIEASAAELASDA